MAMDTHWFSSIQSARISVPGIGNQAGVPAKQSEVHREPVIREDRSDWPARSEITPSRVKTVFPEQPQGVFVTADFHGWGDGMI